MDEFTSEVSIHLLSLFSFDTQRWQIFLCGQQIFPVTAKVSTLGTLVVAISKIRVP